VDEHKVSKENVDKMEPKDIKGAEAFSFFLWWGQKINWRNLEKNKFR
jgi:hypothetical protein